jgi:hypothetical protein
MDPPMSFTHAGIANWVKPPETTSVGAVGGCIAWEGSHLQLRTSGKQIRTACAKLGNTLLLTC